MDSSKKIRILYIGPIPPEVGGQSAGGVATYEWQLANQANKKGYDVYIYADGEKSFVRDEVKVVGIAPYRKFIKLLHGLLVALMRRNKMESLRFLTFKKRVALFYRANLLKTVLKVANPELVHINLMSSMYIISLSILRNHPPIVITEHGDGVIFRNKRFREFKIKNINDHRSRLIEAANRANCIISVSNYSREQLIAEVLDSFDDTKKIKAILNPVDIAKIRLYDRNEVKERLYLGSKRLVFFSGVHLPLENKGLGILLEAFATDDYLYKKCRLLVVTRGEAITFARNFAEEKDIDALILKPQPWENMVKYYNASDVFVMPSRTEGIGLVYEEALSVGVPIVGFSDSVGELEQVLGTYIGEKFDASKEDAKALAEKIRKVLNTDFDRELLRRRMIEKLSWEAKFPEFDAIYQGVLGRRVL